MNKLIESAKCSLCGQKFPEVRSAGVHLKRKHDIGSNNSYPHSPTPVMSSTDRDGFNTPRSSCRLRRRANLPSSTHCQDHSHVHESSVYSSTNPNPLTASDPIPHPLCSLPKDPINNAPQPILMDLDPDDNPDEVSLDSTRSPPRPNTANPQHISFLQQSPEPSVDLSGCTDVISNNPILRSPSVVVLIVTVIVVLTSHLILYQLILRNYYP